MRERTRRQFLGDVSRVGFGLWLAADTAAAVRAEPVAPASTARGILELRLHASDPPALADFYRNTMGWRSTVDGARLVVQAGGTRLVFDRGPDGQRPAYHVAWAIPSNKFQAAKAWLAERTPLLSAPDGRNEFHFRQISRHAVYFADPTGNVLELIARDRLDDRREGAFTLDDILYVNHAGLVVDDMDRTIARLQSSLGLEPTQPPLPTFTKLGDAHRHVVLVPRGRRWLPEDKLPAGVYGTEVVLHGAQEATCTFDDLPYTVKVTA